MKNDSDALNAGTGSSATTQNFHEAVETVAGRDSVDNSERVSQTSTGDGAINVNKADKVTVHHYGDNYFGGSATSSSTTSAIATPLQERELTWWDLGSDELSDHLRVARSDRWRAWMRHWFNWPSFLLIAYSLGLLAWALYVISNVRSLRSIIENLATGMNPIWLVTLHAGVIFPLTFWLGRIRRVESHVAAHAQAEIDAIELVMRRRKGK